MYSLPFELHLESGIIASAEFSECMRCYGRKTLLRRLVHDARSARASSRPENAYTHAKLKIIKYSHYLLCIVGKIKFNKNTPNIANKYVRRQ